MINSKQYQLSSKSLETEPLLNASEVSSHLNISKSMVYRLIQEGGLRTVRIGRTVRVQKSDLQAYILDNLSG